MEASLIQVFTLAFATLFFLFLTTYIYHFSTRKNFLWFMAYVAILNLAVQRLSDTGLALNYHGLYLHIASVLLFPSVILSLFLSYVVDGGKFAREVFFVLLLSTAMYVLLAGAVGILGVSPTFITINLDWARDHISSTLALVADYYMLLVLWTSLHRANVRLPLWLKVFGVFLGILLIDTLIFTFGAFIGNPGIFSILNANITLRLIIALIISPIITIYLAYTISRSHSSLSYRSYSDMFALPEILAESKKISQIKISELESLRSQLEQDKFEQESQNKLLEKQQKAMLNILEDITIEKTLSEQRARDLQKFQEAVEHASDHIVITDSEGKILYANEAVTKITGFTNDEIINQKAGDKKLWGGLMSKEVYEQFWKTIKQDKQTYVGEFTNHRKNGQEYIAETRVSPVLDGNGEIKFFVGIERDITKAKEIDQMKTDFISLASHQLRTPLSAIKWFLEMLGNGELGPLTKEQADAINNINDSNNRMIKLVNSLLNISRIESGRLSIDSAPTDIHDVVNNVETEIAPKLIEKSQKLSINLDSNLPPINLDAKLLEQVVLNLLTNSIKYSPKNTSISLTATVVGDSLQFSVADLGYGIPEEDQRNVFGRFFRAHNIIQKETDGTGLGLYLAKEIVDSMKGKIWFTSKLNHGTTFYFTVPLSGVPSKKGEVSLT